MIQETIFNTTNKSYSEASDDMNLCKKRVLHLKIKKYSENKHIMGFKRLLAQNKGEKAKLPAPKKEKER